VYARPTVNSLDFVIKLFKTINIDIVKKLLKRTEFKLPSIILARRSEHFQLSIRSVIGLMFFL